jgi:hypothetical protein
MSAIGIRSFPVASRVEAEPSARPDHLVLTLTVLGMIAALVMHISLAKAVTEQLEPGQLYSDSIVKPPIYYVAHATQTLLLVWAGLAALFTINFRSIQRGYVWSFSLLIAAAIYTAVKGYSAEDWLSTRLVDSTGPFPFFMSIMVFIGARRGNWGVLSKIMVAMAVVFSAGSLVGMARLQTFDRSEAVANLANMLNPLYWPAAWIALRQYPRDSFVRRLRFLPMIIYALGSLFTQTRLNFVMLFALLLIYAYVQHKRREPQAAMWITGVMIAVWVSLFIGVFLRDNTTIQKISYATDSFSERLDEDTRSSQIQWFFRSNTPLELLVGKGSFAKWQWGPSMWAGSDVGYLTLLLYGGVPLLLMYCVTHILPGYTILRAPNVPDWQLTAAAVVFLWGVRMLSSSYPNVNIDYDPILFCVGACIARDPGAVEARS